MFGLTTCRSFHWYQLADNLTLSIAKQYRLQYIFAIQVHYTVCFCPQSLAVCCVRQCFCPSKRLEWPGCSAISLILWVTVIAIMFTETLPVLYCMAIIYASPSVALANIDADLYCNFSVNFQHDCHSRDS